MITDFKRLALERVKITTAALLSLGALAATGCQGHTVSRLGTDAVAAAAGGVIAAKASHDNPYWTLAGGLAALGGAEYLQGKQAEQQRQALALAYDQGKSQNAQLAYDAIQNAQKNGRPAADRDQPTYTEIPVVTPEHTVNGVRIKQTVEYLKVSK